MNMGDDILRTLQMGVSFSHKKHGREMKMFRGSKHHTQQADTVAHCLQKATITNSSKNEASSIRTAVGIKVKGSAVPAPLLQFEAMSGDHRTKTIVLRNIENSKYNEPTPVQMQSIPAMIEHRDVLAVAPTGSGKTAAFVIPAILQLKHRNKEAARCIILSPTRDLAHQLHREVCKLCKGTGLKCVVLDKANAAGAAQAQTEALKKLHVEKDSGAPAVPLADIVIATPLLLVKLIQDCPQQLQCVELVILDEMDKLFELGFLEQIDTVFAACTHKDLQRAMFTATLPEGTEDLACSVLRDPVRIFCGMRGAGASTVNQQLLFVGKEGGKLVQMRQMIAKGIQPPVLVFVQSKDRAEQLYRELKQERIKVDVIHSSRTQAQRQQSMQRFRMGETWVLIATDLIGRGIDFKGVNMVINYDFPQSIVSYVHRIGRTGRAGRAGTAVTFFTEDDVDLLRSIANVMRLSGCEVPEWMFTLKKASRQKRKMLARSAPKRKRISTEPTYASLKRQKNIEQTETAAAADRTDTSAVEEV